MPVTDVVEIVAPNRFVRPIYAGNAFEHLSSSEPLHILTVRTSVFTPAPLGAAVPVETLAPLAPGRVTTLRAERSAGDFPDLTSAAVVVSGGIAFGSVEKFAALGDLATALGGAVGATRAAVDAGYAPNDWQVGQTGKIVAPDLYIGIGVSGALQHLAGMQGAKRIVAINTDPEAPLVKVADYALIGDLVEIVPQLIAAFRKA
jgi:electron transfer flavoprotein alpha subunit